MTAWANNGDTMSRSVPDRAPARAQAARPPGLRSATDGVAAVDLEGRGLGPPSAYAGTSALKGDFTRTGKRTQAGVLADGVNALTRFYKNNFIDRERQLLIGKRGAPCSRARTGSRPGLTRAGRCVGVPSHPLLGSRAWRPDFLLGNVAVHALDTAASVDHAARPTTPSPNAESFAHMEEDLVRLCR